MEDKPKTTDAQRKVYEDLVALINAKIDGGEVDTIIPALVTVLAQVGSSTQTNPIMLLGYIGSTFKRHYGEAAFLIGALQTAVEDDFPPIETPMQ